MSRRPASIAPAAVSAIQAPAVPAAQAAPIADPLLSPFTTARLIGTLYSAARPHLSRADLLAICDGASQDAENIARSAAELAEGLGSIVAVDGKATCRAGNFQSHHDVPALLFHLAATFRHVEALAQVAELAAGDLMHAPGGDA